MITILLTKIIALLTSISQKSFDNWHAYSTEEKLIGRWINGSNLYEKTFEFTAPQNGTTVNLIDLSELNVEDVTYIDGYIKSEDNITTKNDGFKAWLRTKASTASDNKNQIAMQITNNTYYSCPGVLTIQYTKADT